MAKIQIKNKEIQVAKYTKMTYFLIHSTCIFFFRKSCSSSMRGFPHPRATYTNIQRTLKKLDENHLQSSTLK